MHKLALAVAGAIAFGAAACGGDGSSGEATSSRRSTTTAAEEEIRLSSVLGIALLPDGELLIADGDAGRVVQVDLDNGRLSSFEGALHHLGWIHEFDALSEEPNERQGGTWL